MHSATKTTGAFCKLPILNHDITTTLLRYSNGNASENISESRIKCIGYKATRLPICKLQLFSCRTTVKRNIVKMNSVQELLKTPFSPRSFEKKLIKLLGQPTPNLNIVQSGKSKSNAYKRQFNINIYKEVSWICRCNLTLFFFIKEDQNLFKKHYVEDFNGKVIATLVNCKNQLMDFIFRQ